VARCSRPPAAAVLIFEMDAAARPVWEVGEMGRGRGRGRGLPPPSHVPAPPLMPPAPAVDDEDAEPVSAFFDNLSRAYLAENDGADMLEGLAKVQQSLNSTCCLICLDPVRAEAGGAGGEPRAGQVVCGITAPTASCRRR